MAGWPTSQAKSTSVRGVGRGQFTPNGDLKIKLDDWDAVRVVKKDKLPAVLANRTTLKGKFMFTLNEAKDVVYSAYPAVGMFETKFSDFSMKKDATLPEPYHRVGEKKAKDGRTYHEDYFFFVANFRILEGDNAGMVIPYIVRYYFKPFNLDGEMVAGVTGIGKRYGDQLVNFLDAVGLWKQPPMKYSDNLLPQMLKSILAADKTVVITMKDGWVSALIDKNAENDDEELLDDPDFPAEKTEQPTGQGWITEESKEGEPDSADELTE